jgi:hypothetical protein
VEGDRGRADEGHVVDVEAELGGEFHEGEDIFGLERRRFFELGCRGLRCLGLGEGAGFGCKKAISRTPGVGVGVSSRS